MKMNFERHRYPSEECRAHHFCNFPNGEDFAKATTKDFKTFVQNCTQNKKIDLKDVEIVSPKQNQLEDSFDHYKRIQEALDGSEAVEGQS